MKKTIKKSVLLLAMLAALILMQTTTTYAAPATTAAVGVVNYQQLIQQHPDTPQAQAAYEAAVKQAQDDFTAKSANMNDTEKKAYFQQLQQGIQQKQQDLVNAIRDKINAVIKIVADAKGLTVVVDKTAVVYGGVDITDDVQKKITGK
jgi:outer membrane protein